MRCSEEVDRALAVVPELDHEVVEQPSVDERRTHYADCAVRPRNLTRIRTAMNLSQRQELLVRPFLQTCGGDQVHQPASGCHVPMVVPSSKGSRNGPTTASASSSVVGIGMTERFASAA